MITARNLESGDPIWIKTRHMWHRSTVKNMPLITASRMSDTQNRKRKSVLKLRGIQAKGPNRGILNATTFTHSFSDFVQNLRLKMRFGRPVGCPKWKDGTSVLMRGRGAGSQAMTHQPPLPEPHRATSWVIIAGLVLVMLLVALSAVIPKLTIIALSE